MLKILLYRIAGIINKIVNSLEKIIDAPRSDKLLIAAFVVAILRQMGVNGHFIGYDPASVWLWFQPVEVISGLAMAVLEGLALAYVSRRWRRLEPKDWREWSYWGILLLGQVTMLASVVFYVALYAYAAQRQSVVANVFTPAMNMLWNITVAGANPLIAILIGIVEDNGQTKQESVTLLTEFDECWLAFLELAKQDRARNILPNELAAYANVSEATATQVILDAQKLNLV